MGVLALVAACGGQAVHESTVEHGPPVLVIDAGASTSEGGLHIVLPVDPDAPPTRVNEPSLPPEEHPCDPTADEQVIATNVEAGDRFGFLLGSMPQNGGPSDSLVVASRMDPLPTYKFDIVRIAKDGCSSQRLAHRTGTLQTIAAGSSNAYWIEDAQEGSEPELWTVPNHGGLPQRIDVGPKEFPGAIAADRDALFIYTEGGPAPRLLKATCCDHRVEVLVDAPAFIDLAPLDQVVPLLDGNNVWLEFLDILLDGHGQGAVMHVDRTTHTTSSVDLTPEIQTGNAAAHGGALYVGSGGGLYKLDRVNPPSRIADGEHNWVALDDSSVFWVDGGDVLAMSLANGATRKVASGAAQIAVDDPHVYFTTADHTLVRVRK
jgi:hypothetical protein